MATTVKQLNHLLADTYSLYLKTQNYHWHVTGPNFNVLHQLFEEQYTFLAESVDVLAERIIILGAKAPATFKAFAELTKIKDGDSSLSARDMLSELAADQKQILKDLRAVMSAASAEHDEGTLAIATDLIAKYEKANWKLENHLK